MKFHWGVGIIAVMIIFALGVALLVYTAARQKVDLVTDDYYGEELKHQERIDGSRRTALLKDKIAVTQGGPALRVTFPDYFASDKISGLVTLYRPSDRRSDLTFPLGLDELNSQTFNTSSIEKGLWRLKIKWVHLREEYYFEEVIIIQ